MTLVSDQFLSPSRMTTAMGDLSRRDPLFAGAALVIMAMIPPTLFAAALDPRMLGGVGVWVKPLKFEVSLVAYLATLAWFVPYLPAGTTSRRWYRIFSIVVVAAIAGELVWLVGAAGAGVASHFNSDSVFMSALYGVMGAAAVTLTSATLVFGILIWRNAKAPLSPALRLGIGLGLVMTFVTTVVTAGTMSSGTSHLVGVSTGAMLPIMGWARDAGDLRVAHFFATHAMQAIPFFALLASRLFGLSGTSPVWLFSVAYLALIGLTFAQALSGAPFLPGL